MARENLRTLHGLPQPIKEAAMFTFWMLIASTLIVCGMVAGVVSMDQALHDNPSDW